MGKRLTTGRGWVPDSGAGRSLVATRRPGWRMLVPGWAQWRWGQGGRACVHFGSFFSSAAMAAFLWGTPLGLALLFVAYLTHLASLADALCQSAFPSLGRSPAILASAAALGVCVYAPVVAVASAMAWPAIRGMASYEGYLVNRWAYQSSSPNCDDLVWFRATPWGEFRLGRIVARSGQRIAWAGNQLRVDGRPTKGLGAPFRSAWPPNEVIYQVPDRHILILPEGSPTNHQASEGLLIVSHNQVVGRAWAQIYPVRERRLL